MLLKEIELNVDLELFFVNTPIPSKMVPMYLLQKLDYLIVHINNLTVTFLKYSNVQKQSRKFLMIKTALLKLMWLYQKFFTLIGFGSCRYYPTCSEYARLNFENNSLSSAFYHSLTRILRCNQLFEGGIEYPLLDKLSCKPTKLGIDSIKYWLVPNKKDRYYIIKNFSYKG